MKCYLCDQRKGKRSCPAKNGSLCAPCCGEKRVLEIDCPENCQYLIEGRAREVEDYVKRIRNLDSGTQERNQRVLQEHQEAVARLEYALSRERVASRDLKDKDVMQAIDIMLDTYKTEDKGILYEKTSEDLRVETIRRQLRGIIESLRNPEGKDAKGIVDPKSTRLTLSATIDCLEFIRSLAMAYQGDRSSASGYLDFLARVTPREESRNSIFLA